MKYFKHLLIFFVACIIIYACNKNALNKPTPGSLNETELANKAGVEGLLIGAYSLLDGIGSPNSSSYSAASNWSYGSVCGSEAYTGSSSDDQGADISLETFSETATDGNLESKWSTVYDGVARANEVLRVIKLATDITPDDQQRIIAEARFLRGFYHFEAKKIWNNVPYIDETVTYAARNYHVTNQVDIWTVVDDEEDQEELIMQRFFNKDYLRDYEFLFARDGLKALQLIKDHPDIELALLDINMPEMDGLTLLENINHINPLMRSVMLSAYGDMSNIRAAMNRGAFDFLNKPIDLTDLGITIKKTIEEVRRLKETAKTLNENIVLKQKASELEMQVLRSQMNPHFLFNSLNSINRFILQNNKEQASEYLNKFSKLIRLILQNSQASLITLESELESLELYLALEALRFEHRFDYKISISKDLEASALKVPPLIIQPYAENAIWHGLMHKEEKGRLDVEVSQEKDFLCFKITDDGIGRKKAAELKSKSATKHRSVGLKITEDRIRMMQQINERESPVVINDLVNADGSAGGTEVIIKMPVMYD